MYDVIIVGGGPAGIQALQTLLDRGHDVTLYEKSGELGGGILCEKDVSFKLRLHLLLGNARMRFPVTRVFSGFFLQRVQKGIGKPDESPRPVLKLIPLDPPQNVSLGIAYPTDVKLSPAAEMFIKYSKRIIPGLD